MTNFADRISLAMMIASSAFFNMKDKVGEPLIFHSLRVMMAGKTESERIVGVLHDVLEDSETLASQLYFLTSEELNAVELLAHKNSYDTYKDYILKVSRNKLARRVKVNDVIDNIFRDHPVSMSGMIKDRYLPALKILDETRWRIIAPEFEV